MIDLDFFLIFESLKYAIHILESVDAPLLLASSYARMTLNKHLTPGTIHSFESQLLFLLLLLPEPLFAQLPAKTALPFIVTLTLYIDPPLMNIRIGLV